jgi:hypothetical protein
LDKSVWPEEFAVNPKIRLEDSSKEALNSRYNLSEYYLTVYERKLKL